jgi:hydrogenase expression/formation protein HypE
MEGPVCPIPLRHDDQIVIGHGSGGRLTRDLIEKIFKPYLASPPLGEGNDFARVSLPSLPTDGCLAVSTDAHIVSPLFFPGGDIGRLAVCGTVNDVTMSGARPLYLTASFILEEGFPVLSLVKILASMQAAAEEAGIQIIAGDTKVVEKGKADGVFITTSGIGWIPDGRRITGDQAAPGDAVLISGTLGDHGIAVLAERGDLGFETEVVSDVAPLNSLIERLLEAAPHTHVLRDPTRGGLATTLNEIALQSNVCILLDEKLIPIQPAVRAASEMLGFDPLYIANEGKVIVIVPAAEAETALAALQSHPYGQNAAMIGQVSPDPPGRVLLRTSIGGTRILDMLAGEMLPRIC